MNSRRVIAAAVIGLVLIVLGILGCLRISPDESIGISTGPTTTAETGETVGTHEDTGNPPSTTGTGVPPPTGDKPPAEGEGGDPPVTPPTQPGPGVLRPAAGVCPGAPPTGGGMQRRPDTAKGLDGRLHMVWSENIGGQWDVCYSSKPGEMGLGSSKNPAWRVTNTPTDSVQPRVSVDRVSGLVYVAWVEEMPDAGDDGVYEAIHDGTSLFYSVTENGTFWSKSLSLSAVPDTVKTFEVDRSNGTVKFGDGAQGKRPPAGKGVATEYRFSFDTDSDGILDADEFLGTLGNVTLWWTDDTDGDGLTDRLEYDHGFSPVVNDLYGHDIKRFMEVVMWFSDIDGDAIAWTAENDCDFPVTTRYANVQDTGSVSYRFWPRSSHNATLTLLLQIRRQGVMPPPPPTAANFSVEVTVDAGSAGMFYFDHGGTEMESDRFYVTFGSFSVDEDERTDVTIEVNVEQPPPSDYRTLAIYSVMISRTPGSSEFSYKEGRDYLAGAILASVLTATYETCGDPVRPDLFLEIDAISGHNPTAEVFSEAINVYSDAGIILHYRLDETSISMSEATTTDSDGDGAATLNDCTDPDELTDFLDEHRNTASPFDRYIHVIFAHNVKAETGWGCSVLYGIAKSADLASDHTHSGVLIADDQIDSPITTATVIQQRTKILTHEVGHALGASHEKSTGLCNMCVDGSTTADTNNGYNLMAQDGLSVSTDVNKRILGIGNTVRCKGSASYIGMPRFSIESINQLDLKNKLSADTGRNIDILGNYV